MRLLLLSIIFIHQNNSGFKDRVFAAGFRAAAGEEMELSWEHWNGDPSEVEPVPKLKASYAFPLSAPSLLSVGQLSLPQPATEDPTQNAPASQGIVEHA